MELEELRNLTVEEDKNLLDVEKETYVHIEGKSFVMTSNEKPYIKYMLGCDELDPIRYYTDEEGNLVHLEGNLSLSHLRLKNKGWDNNEPSRIIN
jgi:hypothetical protein